MAFNYFVAYDLNDPGQNYPAVSDTIESLGKHAKIQLSLYYLKSDLSMAAIHARVRSVMDVNDRLAVIWAQDAFISNYPDTVMGILQGEFQNA